MSKNLFVAHSSHDTAFLVRAFCESYRQSSGNNPPESLAATKAVSLISPSLVLQSGNAGTQHRCSSSHANPTLYAKKIRILQTCSSTAEVHFVAAFQHLQEKLGTVASNRLCAYLQSYCMLCMASTMSIA